MDATNIAPRRTALSTPVRVSLVRRRKDGRSSPKEVTATCASAGVGRLLTAPSTTAASSTPAARTSTASCTGTGSSSSPRETATAATATTGPLAAAPRERAPSPVCRHCDRPGGGPHVSVTNINSVVIKRC